MMEEQNLINKEIEEFLIKNINERENEIKLLTESYEDDISKFEDGNRNLILDDVYIDIIKKLRDELKSEVKKINDKYEVQRANHIEKIKSNYLR
jgi:hypothetical protein